ncbi:MAG: TlpA family protein disulfide reductase [Myxococcaceae bacterium]
MALLGGCPDEKPSGPAPSRFAGVSSGAAAKQAAQFCDRSFPAAGGPEHPYRPAQTRPLSGADPAPPGKGWRWVNAWATWCAPCVEEMGLLTRWRDALGEDGLRVSFELLSIDEAEAEPELRKWVKKSLPGKVQWIRSEEDFGTWLDALGIERDAAVPIHVLVDPKGQVRCVRVGAVHAQDYGAVRAIVSGA